MAKKKGESTYDLTSSGGDETEAKRLDDYSRKVASWYTYYNEHIIRARNTLTFLYVDQWEIQDRQKRESIGKPTMQFNKLAAIVRGILGEQRENSPNIAVRAITKDVPQEAVNMRENLIRQISYASDSDLVYQIAYHHMLTIGWGAIRVITEYENQNTLNQTIRILPVTDFEVAYFDPNARLPSKEDGAFCGIYTTMSKEDFERKYPDAKDPQSVMPENYFMWYTTETVTMCEHYYKDYFKKTIVRMSDGEFMEEKEAKELIKAQQALYDANPEDFELMGVQPLEIIETGEILDWKIKYCKFVRNQSLEEGEFPGKLLPIVYAEGDSVVIQGERLPLPYIQDAIDPQKLLNYIESEIARGVLTARKENYFMTPTQMAGFEMVYRNPDQVQGALPYNPDPLASGPPIPVQARPFPEMFVDVLGRQDMNIQQTLGTYDENHGKETNAISGVAINRRQQASNKPVNVYQDNLKRAIRQVGKIIMGIMPDIYGGERDVMTMKSNGQSQIETLNKPNGYQMNPQTGDVDEVLKNDMSLGEYDIEVRIDGSFAMQKQEALQTLLQLAAINPAIGNLIPDLLAEESGLSNTQQVVERLRTLVPPNIIAKEQGLPPPPPPPSPPPDPKVVTAQLKSQTDMATLQVKQQQAAMEAQIKSKSIDLEHEKLMLQARQSGIDNFIGLNKAHAEIHKANTDLRQTNLGLLGKMIDHGSKLKLAKLKLSQANKPSAQDAENTKIDNAMERRVSLDEQSNVLKGVGL